MIYIYFAATEKTATSVAQYLKTWRIMVFYNADTRMYYANATSVLDMQRITSALKVYGLISE
jgi:hypothetical protein